MSKRHPKLLLGDILDSAEKIFRYTENLTYEEFIEDSKTIDAVVRNFEIIGEATHQLPQKFKEDNDSIDWFRIRGFRNRIVHDYVGIDYELMWALRDTHLQELILKVENILASTDI
jgi:uncharacterized protein with HEPN domain